MPRYFVGLLIGFFLTLSAFSNRDARSYYEEGLQSLRQKNYIKAIGDFTSAVSLSPNFADAYFERANAKEMLASQHGFVSNEQCADWLQALQLGKQEAAQKLLEGCGNECVTTTSLSEVSLQAVLCLDWSNQHLTHLSDQVNKLDNLLRLDISNNALHNWDNNTVLGKYIIQLDASRNQIAEFPSAISRLTQLRELNLSYNQIKTVPVNIGQLQDLRELYLRNNALQALPSQIADLKALEHLDLSFNRLHSLPASMEKLKNLKHLKLVGNPISIQQQKVIQALLPHCKIAFD